MRLLATISPVPRPLRISAISFLNTAPLMWDFDKGRPPVAPPLSRPVLERQGGDVPQSSIINRHSDFGFDVSYTIPSACADQLRAGTADIGIIPAITYATIPGLVILPDAVIAAKNDVRS